MRVIDFFDRGVALDPERICLKDASVTRTYAEVHRQSCLIANALIRDGLAPEAKAAVYSPNAAAPFECVLGIFRAGGAWVPINARNAVPENAYILDNCDVEVLFYHSEFEANVARFAEQCPTIRQYVCIDRAGGRGTWLDDLIRDVPATDPDVPGGRDSLASIFSSGGTTGRPKGVMWTNLVWEIMLANFYTSMPRRKPPVHLVVAPMTHAAGGLAILMMAQGTTHVILPQFHAQAVAETIQNEGVTHLFLPPTAIYVLLAHKEVAKYDYSSLEHFIYAAAPMSVEKLKECLAVFGPVMSQTFGQAEAPMLCTFLSPEGHQVIGDPEKEKRLASCGRPTLHTAVAIMDDDGHLLGPDERGEIVVRGNLVMPGYYRNQAATDEVSTFGWHHTGDIGYRDRDGYVYIVDRKKDMIISGGFNIYPSEIEQVIWSHPAVQDCAVVGVPDEKWGEAVKAVIELKPGASLGEDEVIRLCKETLGSVKAPKSAEFWPALPRSPVGKVRKKDIRESFWAGRDRAI
ncbi:AMP-binding protein [Oceanibacterium hippocampi]|uniref:3-methylmercaptopropionyl-CoA ligase n=1 Tax=Oceanibacterium hippocampi TaxID=745714 RepID=A0A1Y5RRX6_9PROT|nr:AMP-binding protein [Oceanibacterium hippocampi]SLN23925.1 Long-chain-fatty-acid--CoA ligase FadD13 [Oceanibacterium hippocampi]